MSAIGKCCNRCGNSHDNDGYYCDNCILARRLEGLKYDADKKRKEYKEQVKRFADDMIKKEVKK